MGDLLPWADIEKEYNSRLDNKEKGFRETMRKKKERMEENLKRMDELELQGFFA
jgi:hypothetical protein